MTEPYRSIMDLKLDKYTDAIFHIELALERLRAKEHKTTVGEIVKFLRDAIDDLQDKP